VLLIVAELALAAKYPALYAKLIAALSTLVVPVNLLDVVVSFK
jgi:hypothetical protein